MTPRLLAAVALVTSGCTVAGSPDLTTIHADGFADEVLMRDLPQATGFAFAPDGRLFIWSKDGRLFRAEGGALVQPPVLDISAEVGNFHDHGLLGVALDPAFDQNGFVYLLYRVDPPLLGVGGDPDGNQASIGRVTRFTIAGGQADPASRLVLLGEDAGSGVPMTHDSHGVGALAFGDDGTLLVATGDGASFAGMDDGTTGNSRADQALASGILRPEENVGAFRAQRLDSLSGKILRLDPATGDGVPSNPFFDPAAPRAPASRVWSYGLRNPFRIALQPGSGSTDPADGRPGTLYIGDVGYNSWEELDVADRGGQNFGWPVFEGQGEQPEYSTSALAAAHWPADPRPPLVTWGHGNPTAGAPVELPGSCAIGGAFYPGGAYPEAFQGAYVAGDLTGGWIKAFQIGADGAVAATLDLVDTGAVPIAIAAHPQTGDIYWLHNLSELHRVTSTANRAPIPSLVVTGEQTFELAGAVLVSVDFDAGGSIDPEGQPLGFHWQFGDGQASDEVAPHHWYLARAGDPVAFDVVLTVTDAGGAAATARTRNRNGNDAPLATITAPGALLADEDPFTDGLQVHYAAEVSDPEGGEVTCTWDALLAHNTHTHPEPPVTGCEVAVTLPDATCDGANTYSYPITLTATDPLGRATTATITATGPGC
ncbi:MAG TPA: PQQ-dependent sugar dehydrogenase, partial [Kofleriaceae bacterium]|nr:PQQ-dependent sugar dehydrogenase [Kofleriaceae bacterium]